MDKYRLILLGGLIFSLIGCDRQDAAAPESTAENVVERVADLKAGRAHFDTCAACHGQEGQGNREMGAPALVNMAPWSMKNQLLKFRTGLRGRHAEDEWGAQMADMAETLDDAQAVVDVVAYIDGLPDRKPKQTLTGNPANGERYYNMICGACHGPAGEGSAALQAPTLVGVDDWYLQRQYQNFAAKIRGYHADDKAGRQMGLMSNSLPDAQTLTDILFYVQSSDEKAVP